MDDFIVGAQCEEMQEEEFERGKRSLLELFDDAAQLDKDWVEIMSSWEESGNDKSSIYGLNMDTL